jgi:hypothetical protein
MDKADMALSIFHLIKKVVIQDRLGGEKFGDVYRGTMNVSSHCLLF